VLGTYSLFILVLNRGIIGKEGTYLLDSYYVTTWCLVAILWLTLRSHREAQRANDQPDTIPLPGLETSKAKSA
jgi:hypothetical protein